MAEQWNESSAAQGQHGALSGPEPGEAQGEAAASRSCQGSLDGTAPAPGPESASAARVRYEGEFELAWLRDGERVMGAGDGTGAAIIVSPDGSERRVNIGDEIPAKSGPGQAPSFLSRRPASETETAGASSSAATTERERLWREHELLVRLSREHGRRMGHLAAQVQPVLRRIWEIDNGK